eukprot:5494468-Prymnesium_polylepis.1
MPGHTDESTTPAARWLSAQVSSQHSTCNHAVVCITGVQGSSLTCQAQHSQHHRFHPCHRPCTGDHSG